MVSLQVSVALATIGVYLLAMLGVGYRGWQVGSLDVADWMTADRGLGILVLTFTYAATFHSAFAFLGAAGFIYQNGIGIYLAAYVWFMMGSVIMWVVGSRVWLLGDKFDYITPSDVFADFYDSELLGKFVSLVLILFTFPYIAVQMMGTGIIFEVATNGLISFEVGAAVLLVVGVAYVWLGGLRSVAWTDTIQGIFMIVAIWVATIVFLFNAYNGSPGAFWGEITREFAAHVTLPGPTGIYTPAFLLSWMVILGIGLMMTPHIFLRYFAADSPRTLKWVSVTGTSYLLIFYIPIGVIALGGLALLPGLANPDTVLPRVLYEYTPVWFASIVVSGAIAAAMSTADSQLHAVATLITRDWYEDFAGTELTQEGETRFAKLMIPLLGIVSYVVAIQDFGFIVTITNVSLEGAAQIFPLLLGVLFWRRASEAGALAGFGVGVTVTTLLKFDIVTLPSAFPGFMAGFYGILLNTAVFVAVSYVTGTSTESVDRVHGFLDSIGEGNESYPADTPSDD